MTPTLFILVSGDPRTSPRPAEAVRIAAGLSAGKRIDVSLYLQDAAVLALGEFAEDLSDGEHFMRYLPLLVESGREILVQEKCPELANLTNSPHAFRAIGDEESSDLIARSNHVMRF